MYYDVLMDIAATNFSTTPIPLTGGQAPALRPATVVLQPSRNIGTDLAIPENATLRAAESFTTLRRLGDSTKSIVSKVLKFGAFVGATASVAATFALNLKSVGLLFAIPTAMAFFIAHTLQRSLKETDPKFLTDPLRDLKAINHDPQKLETNMNQVMYVIEDAKKVKPDKPEYEPIQDELSKLKHLIEVQARQYVGAEDERSLGLAQDMQVYLEALAGIQSKSVISPNLTTVTNKPSSTLGSTEKFKFF